MHRGKLEQPPDSIHVCGDDCFVVTGKYTDSFLPVIFSGAQDFVKSSCLRRATMAPKFTVLKFRSEACGGTPVDFDQLVQHFKDAQTLVDQY